MKTSPPRSPLQRAAGALAVAALLALAPSSQAQAVQFAQVYHPLGITVTQQGQIITYADFIGSHGYKFYAPNGQLLGTKQVGAAASGWNIAGQIANRSFGGIADTEGLCRLATVPAWGGLVLGLRQDGGIVWYDPASQQGDFWVNLRLVPTDTSRIYDVAQGRAHAFNGQVSNVNANYGDIAAYRGRDARGRGYTAFFVTGLSYPAIFTFIQRVRCFDDRTWDSKIIAGSTASTAGSLNNARGVAVNAAGTVGAVLPFQSNAGALDYFFQFAADFDETGRGLPAVKANGVPMGGEGLSTDRGGNFYVATGKTGIAYNGAAYGGALVKVSATGNLSRIYPTFTGLGDTRDVALSLDDRYAYVSAHQNSVIVRVQLF